MPGFLEPSRSPPPLPPGAGMSSLVSNCEDVLAASRGPAAGRSDPRLRMPDWCTPCHAPQCSSFYGYLSSCSHKPQQPRSKQASSS